jgi:hypothetical protein
MDQPQARVYACRPGSDIVDRSMDAFQSQSWRT